MASSTPTLAATAEIGAVIDLYKSGKCGNAGTLSVKWMREAES